MAPATAERLFGKSIKRREDPRFITGRGSYVDDLKIPGMTYAAFVRSPHAHARIRRIDTRSEERRVGKECRSRRGPDGEEEQEADMRSDTECSERTE